MQKYINFCSGNTTTGNGGAINNAAGANVYLQGGTITANSAAAGGAIYSEGTVNIKGTVSVTGNTVTNSFPEATSNLVLDKEGKKMSKSRGNTVNPFELFDQYGADALRWYLLYVSPPWTPTRFDVDGLKEVQSKFLGTMKNVYNFFTLYANTDEVNPKDFFVDYKNRPELDRWILSKVNNLKKEVEENLEIFELNKTVRMIQDFINEDLSNWYIRRSRRRFWATELTEDKKSVYNTTYEILTELCQLIAPFAPYISEEIYRNLTGEVSVHLSNYPKANLELINPELEEKMDLVKNLVTLGRASREATRIKVRQPIQKVLVDGKFKDTISDVVDLIKEELNVKEVVFAKDLGEYMN